MRRIRSKLTYSNVMVTVLALLVLGGGTAYAASALEKESVGTKQLAKGAVTPAKLSKAAKAKMTGPAGPKGATGAPGAQGAQGIQGPKGDPGAPATALWAVVSGAGELQPGSSSGAITAKPKGTGNYSVAFNRDVEKCSYSVTSRNALVTAMAQPGAEGTNTVFLSFYNPSGAGNFVSTSFSIAVFC
jgi:hypothetical protein